MPVVTAPLPRLFATPARFFASIATVVILSLTGCDSVREPGLKPFASDGCSAWPDGTMAQKDLWLECCQVHDVAYWQGGTRLERLNADEALRTCVADIGEPAMGAVMLAGVRVGGSPWWPSSFRWGYGWPWPRGYGALSDADRDAVTARLKDATTR